MKKTILATLVAFSAIGANAAEINVNVPAEVYGKVGVSVDAYQVGDKTAGTQEDKTDLNVTRNTEVGLKGAADVSNGFEAAYDVRLGFEGNDGDYEAALKRANVTVKNDLVFVTAGKAESTYDQATRKMDVFADTFAAEPVKGQAEFELYDGVEAREQVTVGVTPIKDLTLSVDVAGDDLGDTLAVSGKYSIQGLDLAAGYEATDGLVDTKDTDVDSIKVGAGYDFAGVGVDGLYVGFIHEDADFDKGGDDFTTDSVTASYALTADIKLAAGYAVKDIDSASRNDVETLRFGADYAFAKDVTVKAGYALVTEDGKDDQEQFTAGVIYKF